MKAVVVKTHRNYAVLLKSDGSFVRVPNKRYGIGQEIYIKEVSKTLKFASIAKVAAAAAAFFLVIGGGFSYAYNIPQSYISIDINPSIELELNMFNHVINADGANDDGSTVLENVEINNKSMEKAIQIIVSEINKEGYFDLDDEKTVVIGVHCKNENKQQKVMESTRSQAEKSLEDLHISAAVSINEISMQTVKSAERMGTTGGKLNLIEDYIDITDTETKPEEMVDVPVQEIVKEINAHQSNGNGNGTGNNPNMQPGNDDDQDFEDEIDTDTPDDKDKSDDIDKVKDDDKAKDDVEDKVKDKDQDDDDKVNERDDDEDEDGDAGDRPDKGLGDDEDQHQDREDSGSNRPNDDDDIDETDDNDDNDSEDDD